MKGEKEDAGYGLSWTNIQLRKPLAFSTELALGGA